MIDLKCIYLQEDFLKENVLIQVRMLLDKRNLHFHMEDGEYTFASWSKFKGSQPNSFDTPHTQKPGSLEFLAKLKILHI